MATNATLTYLDENRMFVYEDGQFKTTGNKVTFSGTFKRVDGGQIWKDEKLLGSFSFMVKDGVMTDLWMSIINPLNAMAFIGQINACFSALNDSNGAE